MTGEPEFVGITDEQAMNRLRDLLSGKEWDSSYIEEVAEVVRLTGREVTGPTRTVYVVDEQGATWWFGTQLEAEARFLDEGWKGAVHLAIGTVEVPETLTASEVTDYVIRHAPDAACESSR